MTKRLLLLGVLGLAAYSAKRVHEEPIIEQGDRIPDPEATAAATAAGQSERAEMAREQEDLTAAALAECEPEICEAVVRGEVVLGMNAVQVFAATRTTPGAWTARRAGNAEVLVPRSLELAPRDAVSELAVVRLADGRVSQYGYREVSGMRLVSSPADATTEGRSAALAEDLIREGDELAAAGDLERALDRYDRASILRPADALLDYRIATVLEKTLRPIEALIQYQLFLHRLELERIEAEGDAAAKLADAIAHAKERIIVLEKHGG
ncbi:MAG: hypothetical protein ACE5JR_00850 [Gemmatimonadota bacterium]